MPSNFNSNSKAEAISIAVVAASALAGLGFAAYQYFSKKSENNQQEHREADRQQHREMPSSSQTCIVCKRNLQSEETFVLDCNHNFHKLCLQANLYLHRDKKEWLCPYSDCKRVVSEETKVRLVR